jgi:hypothetical protein
MHAAFGVTITWAGYQIGRTLFSPEVAWSSDFVLALHPYLVKLTMQIVDTGPSVAFSSLAWCASCAPGTTPLGPVSMRSRDSSSGSQRWYVPFRDRPLASSPWSSSSGWYCSGDPALPSGRAQRSSLWGWR